MFRLNTLRILKARLIPILVLTTGLLLFYVQPASAFPPLPSGFYGTVKINGANVSAGTVISAKINGVQYTSIIVMTYQGDTVFSLDVPGDDTDTPEAIEGGVEGDTVVFYIGSTQADQTGTWHGGTNIHLNLTGFANQAPTGISLSYSSVVENSPANTVVGALSSTDPDDGDTFTYSLVSGAGDTDNASFNISGNSLRTSAVFDFETRSSYSVCIQTTDQGGLYYKKAFTISITISAVNLNEPSSIYLPLIRR